MCYYVQIGDVLIGTPNPPQRFSELLNNGGVYDFGRFPAGTIPSLRWECLQCALAIIKQTVSLILSLLHPAHVDSSTPLLREQVLLCC